MPGLFAVFAARHNRRRYYKNSRKFVPNAVDAQHSTYRVRSCFGLNLRSCIGSSTSISDTEYCRSDDSSQGHLMTSPLQAAIQTAKVFNGIVVGMDGTLLSQNERAEKKLLGKMIKEGQSRQAVKIEHMLDATDCGSIHCKDVGQERSNTSPTSQLLLIRGHFDDLNRLLSEGAWLLRKKESICWLPPSVLDRISDYCSSKDIISLSESCKVMHENMKETRSVRKQRQTWRQPKTKHWLRLQRKRR